jgi:hypothetical protein
MIRRLHERLGISAEVLIQQPRRSRAGCWLAGDVPAFPTGHVLVVDGGFTAAGLIVSAEQLPDQGLSLTSAREPDGSGTNLPSCHTQSEATASGPCTSPLASKLASTPMTWNVPDRRAWATAGPSVAPAAATAWAHIITSL